jgi:hypothetical protein
MTGFTARRLLGLRVDALQCIVEPGVPAHGAGPNEGEVAYGLHIGRSARSDRATGRATAAVTSLYVIECAHRSVPSPF